MCVALPAVSSGAEQLHVKLGLWEISTETQSRGMPPLPQEMFAKMTPEQRRKMEADMLAAQAEGPDKDTDTQCITQKDLEHPFQSSNAKECKQTIVQTTRTSQEVRIVCSGGVPGSGVLKVSTPTPEKMSGTMALKIGEGSNAMTIDAKMQGRWISSDCGDEANSDDADDDADEDDA